MRRAFRFATLTALAAVVASSGEVNANTQEVVRSLEAEQGMTADVVAEAQVESLLGPLEEEEDEHRELTFKGYKKKGSKKGSKKVYKKKGRGSDSDSDSDKGRKGKKVYKKKGRKSDSDSDYDKSAKKGKKVYKKKGRGSDSDSDGSDSDAGYKRKPNKGRKGRKGRKDDSDSSDGGHKVSRRRNGRGFHRFLSDLHADAQLAAALEAAEALEMLHERGLWSEDNDSDNDSDDDSEQEGQQQEDSDHSDSEHDEEEETHTEEPTLEETPIEVASIEASQPDLSEAVWEPDADEVNAIAAYFDDANAVEMADPAVEGTSEVTTEPSTDAIPAEEVPAEPSTEVPSEVPTDIPADGAYEEAHITVEQP